MGDKLNSDWLHLKVENDVLNSFSVQHTSIIQKEVSRLYPSNLPLKEIKELKSYQCRSRIKYVISEQSESG